MDFDGKVLLEESLPIDVTPLASKVYLDWPLKKLTDAGATDTSRVFVVADLTAGGVSVSRNLIYLAPVKEIHLKKPISRWKPWNRAGATGCLTSPVLARSVYLSFGNLDVKLSDNYFILTGRDGRNRRYQCRLSQRSQGPIEDRLTQRCPWRGRPANHGDGSAVEVKKKAGESRSGLFAGVYQLARKRTLPERRCGVRLSPKAKQTGRRRGWSIYRNGCRGHKLSLSLGAARGPRFPRGCRS